MLTGGVSARRSHLVDDGQLGEQHLENGRRERLLENLEELLRLTTHRDGVAQVIHAFLQLPWSQKGEQKGLAPVLMEM